MTKRLVVDHGLAVQMTISLLLKRAGYSVMVASDGERGGYGVRDCRVRPVLDIFMPGLDGLETMRLIFRQRPTIPIVTSHRPLTLEPDLPAMAAKRGATISPPKPFKPAAPLAAAEGRIAGSDAGFADTGARA